MSYSPSSDYNLEVARGNVPGQSIVVMRGHNPTQTSASGFLDVWEAGSDLAYLTTAEAMNIVSTDAADASAGTGMRSVLVQGVDNTGALVQESITMNGTTDVLTVNSYLRVNFIIGLTVGSVGWNVGIITATAAVAATVQNRMNAIQAISHNSHYTVPLGSTLFIQQVEFNVAKNAGGTAPVVDFEVIARQGGDGAAWVQFADKKINAASQNTYDLLLPYPANQPIARTDIRIRTDTDQNSTEVRTRMYGILIED